MSRAIKFRAWDKEYGFMYQNAHPFEHLVYVEMHDDDETFEQFKHKMQVINGKHFYWIIAKDMELMQFTGLRDKNDTEICEGDILAVENAKGEVYWNYNGGFDVRGVTNKKQWSYRLYHYITYCEVIGNIYENPDLVTI